MSRPPTRRTVERRDLPVTGMSCAACVSNVEAAIGAVPGVTGVVVNLATQRATVAIELGTDLSAVQSAVERAGYGLVVPATGAGTGEPEALRDAEAAARAADTEDIRRRFYVALVFGLPVLVLGMSHGALAFRGERWLQLALTVPVLFWAGSGYFTRAWSGLRHRSADMNTLVALGTGAAFSYSVAATVAPGLVTAGGAHAGHAAPPVYFEAAAGIVVLVLFGKLLETGARTRTSSATARARQAAGQDRPRGPRRRRGGGRGREPGDRRRRGGAAGGGDPDRRPGRGRDVRGRRIDADRGERAGREDAGRRRSPAPPSTRPGRSVSA